MRYSYAVFAVMLVVATIGAYGGEAAQPVPTSGQCAVPADPQWTPQEKFVWGRVCIGEIADFNIGQEYGGDLDPKGTAGRPDPTAGIP